MLRTAYRDVIHWSGIVGAAISISGPHHEGRPLLVRVTYVLIAAVAADAPMPIPASPFADPVDRNATCILALARIGLTSCLILGWVADGVAYALLARRCIFILPGFLVLATLNAIALVAESLVQGPVPAAGQET